MESVAQQPAALLFINTTHPEDATTPGSLRQIRSHAAKEIRLRRRRKAAPSRSGNPKERSGDSSDSYEYHNTPQHPAKSPSPEHDTARNDIWTFTPPSSPFLPSARRLTDVEGFLLDHYVNYVVPLDNGRCRKNGDGSSPEFIGTQWKNWVPFALSDVGVLAILFLQAARSLEGLVDISSRDSYTLLASRYRLQCIRATNKALSSSQEVQIGDATISTVMALAADEHFLMNFVVWNVHLKALHKMVSMRGGIDALGVGGFMKDVLVNTPSVYHY